MINNGAFVSNELQFPWFLSRFLSLFTDSIFCWLFLIFKCQPAKYWQQLWDNCLFSSPSCRGKKKKKRRNLKRQLAWSSEASTTSCTFSDSTKLWRLQELERCSIPHYLRSLPSQPKWHLGAMDLYHRVLSDSHGQMSPAQRSLGPPLPTGVCRKGWWPKVVKLEEHPLGN